MSTDIDPASAEAVSAETAGTEAASAEAASITAASAAEGKVPGWEESRAVAEASRQTAWERPSFAKALYLGDFQWDLMHPVPEISARNTASASFWRNGSVSGLRPEVSDARTV